MANGILTIDQGLITWDSYTPTLTNTANITASTPYVSQWSRVGNFVTVMGKVDIDPTTGATPTTLEISLPIASNFAAVEDLAGVAVSTDATLSMSSSIFGSVANDRAVMTFTVGADVSNRAWAYQFSYQII